eukprot:gene12131-25742_t
MARSPITTHILDTSVGSPASGVPISLKLLSDAGAFEEVGAGTTDADGRCGTLLPAEGFKSGTYQIRFEVQTYFDSSGRDAFYPFCEITFIVKDPSQHFHVPLLL